MDVTPARLHHLAITVSDVEVGVPFYEAVFGVAHQVDVPHPGGVGKLLADDDHELMIVVHHHDANDGAPFVETVNGLDHAGFFVPIAGRPRSLAAPPRALWRRASRGGRRALLTQSPIVDEAYGSVLVFRDPDNIQLELFCPPGG